MDSTRVDKWLWAVRVYPTRTAATDACHGGHVKVNGKPAKPSATVVFGDRIVVRVNAQERVLEVARVIDKRVGAPIAAECIVDHTPPPTAIDEAGPVFARDRAAGRPTKRDRRQLDRFRQR